MAGRKHEPTVLLNTMCCLMLTGRTHAEIGEIVGRTRENVTRSLESPDGMKLLDRLRQEAQGQIFDPVQQQLDSYARQAMQEAWDMRLSVDSEKLSYEIRRDVLHMAGYRPHTNTDKQVEQLPTVVMGTMNVQINNDNGADGPVPQVTMPDVQLTAVEETPNGADKQIQLAVPGHDEDEQASRSIREPQFKDAEFRDYENEDKDDPRFVSCTRWASGEVEHGENSESGECVGDKRDEQFEPTFPI